MFLTFGQIKKYVAKYAGNGGKCHTSPEVDAFAMQVLHKYLLEGADTLRKFCFHAVKGCITLPYELATPLKVKIDDGNLSKVWSKWKEFYTQDTLRDGVNAGDALYEDVNSYFTVYDIPYPEAYVGALALEKEDAEAYLIVQGYDITGREVITQHKGETVYGEYLPLQQNKTVISTVKFSKITGINKSRTKGSVQLYAFNPIKSERYFLSEYTGYEETPE